MRRVLIAALGSPDSDVRFRAATALGTLGEEPLATAVRAALIGDVAPLAALRDPRAVAPLLFALRRGQGSARPSAAAALGSLGAAAAAAVGPLEETLQHGDGDRATRDAIHDALCDIHDALEDAPAELEAASAPAGSGSELEAASAPPGAGAELEALPDDAESKARMPKLVQSRRRPRWRFW